MSPAPDIDSDIGRLDFWGSDCMRCGNTTPNSMYCDGCEKNDKTVALWIKRPKTE